MNEMQSEVTIPRNIEFYKVMVKFALDELLFESISPFVEGASCCKTSFWIVVPLAYPNHTHHAKTLPAYLLAPLWHLETSFLAQNHLVLRGTEQVLVSSVCLESIQSLLWV